MSLDLSIWDNKHLNISLQQSLSPLAVNVNDPTKIWIAFLMGYGGFITLLGIPALIAIASFIRRARWLKANCKPHSYGRTNLIYWPSQILILSACLALLSFIKYLILDAQNSDDGLLAGTILTLIAWVNISSVRRKIILTRHSSSNHVTAFGKLFSLLPFRSIESSIDIPSVHQTLCSHTTSLHCASARLSCTYSRWMNTQRTHSSTCYTLLSP